jgi:uncharacterized protein involved in exopolysaccharide biosynthesis
MKTQSTLYDYWMALYSRKEIILVVSLSSLVFALVISFALPSVYEAKASFYLPMNMKAATYTSDFAQQELAQQPLIPVLDEAGASVHIGILKSDDVVSTLISMFPDKTRSYFNKNVDIVSSPELFVDVHVRDRDPEVASKIANAYSKIYQDFHAQLLSAKAAQTYNTMESKLAELGKAIEQKSDELVKFQEANNLLSSTDTQERLAEQTTDMENRLSMAKVDLIATKERLKELRNQQNTELKKGHSKLIDSIREALLHEESEEVYLGAKSKALRQEIEAVKESTRTSLPMLMTLDSLTHEKSILDEMRFNVKKNLSEAFLQKEFPSVMVVVVQKAIAPTQATFPRPFLNAIVALLFGFAASCYYALFLEYLNRLKISRIQRNLQNSPLQELQS